MVTLNGSWRSCLPLVRNYIIAQNRTRHLTGDIGSTSHDILMCRLFKCWLTVHKVHYILIQIPRLLSQKDKKCYTQIISRCSPTFTLWIHLLFEIMYLYPTLEARWHSTQLGSEVHCVSPVPSFNVPGLTYYIGCLVSLYTWSRQLMRVYASSQFNKL